MFTRRALASLFISVLILGLYAQDPSKVKIVDLEDVTIVIENATTSSADVTGDFPVYLDGEKQMKKFDDLYMILVRHDLQASDPNIYICVELIDMDDQSSIFEMAKYMRVSGTAETGPFSIQVNKLNTLQVIRKGY
ncbi:MAG: hypothetical protein R6W31_01020 [Bacteroidales bacterium]